MDEFDKAAYERSLKIDEEIKKEKKLLQNQMKLLLLGAADTGKSTFVRQMKIIHGSGYTEDEKREAIHTIYNNILDSAKKLIGAMKTLKFDYQDPENSERSKKILALPILEQGDSISSEIWESLKTIWKDECVKNCYKRRNEFELTDSTEYYFDALDRILDKNYLPQEQDILRIRKATSGIHESFFNIGIYQFRLIDVGGQRTERRKWIHCFEGVTAIVFLAALSEYNQKLTECKDVNRLRESIELYKEILQLQWFERSSIILFLNKKDIFAKKIFEYKLEDYFIEYKGARDNVLEAREFIFHMFDGINKSLKKRAYTHYTCATDTENMRFVFSAVQDSILSQNMSRVNLNL